MLEKVEGETVDAANDWGEEISTNKKLYTNSSSSSSSSSSDSDAEGQDQISALKSGQAGRVRRVQFPDNPAKTPAAPVVGRAVGGKGRLTGLESRIASMEEKLDKVIKCLDKVNSG